LEKAATGLSKTSIISTIADYRGDPNVLDVTFETFALIFEYFQAGWISVSRLILATGKC
jgi:hypothetical protein